MASTLKVDRIETPGGVGNISFGNPISGDGSQLTGVGLAVGGGAVTAGDFLYHDGTEWTRLPKGTAAQYLRMNAGATAPEWIATTGAGIQVPASSAAGDILYYDGSNYVRLAKGTAAQTLAMNSGATAPEWIAPAGGGAWEYLSTSTFTNVATVDITSADGISQANHSAIACHFEGVFPVNGNESMLMRYSEDDGSSFSSAADYNMASTGFNDAGSAATAYDSNSTSIRFSPANPDSSVNTGLWGWLYFPMTTQTSQNINTTWNMSCCDTSNNITIGTGAGSKRSSGGGDWDAFQFLCTSGNITGTIRIYGIKQSSGGAPPLP